MAGRAPSGDILWDGPERAQWTIALAHGAGQAMDSPFMNTVAEGLGARGFRIARFEFPYMAKRRETGRNRPPDRPSVLLDSWRGVVDRIGGRRLVIGGKSLGGRIASMIADETGVAGLVCLGYPFHPPGRPDRPRTGHLEGLCTPALICQGMRDPFGTQEEVAGYRLSDAIRLHWLFDGDHGFRPRRSSGRTEAQNLEEAIGAVAGFIRSLKSA